MRDSDGSMRGPADTNLHFVYFEAGNANQHGSFELARILRRRIFIEELGIRNQVEFDKHDTISRHVLGLFGDAPACYARWRLDGNIAIIDRLCTLNGYRQRRVARKCLENVVQDISSCSVALNSVVQGLIVLVPKHERALQQKLLDANFSPLEGLVPHHMPSIQMWLPANHGETSTS